MCKNRTCVAENGDNPFHKCVFLPPTWDPYYSAALDDFGYEDAYELYCDDPEQPPF